LKNCGSDRYREGCGDEVVEYDSSTSPRPADSGECTTCANDCESGYYRSGCKDLSSGICTQCIYSRCEPGMYLSQCAYTNEGVCVPCRTPNPGKFWISNGRTLCLCVCRIILSRPTPFHNIFTPQVLKMRVEIRIVIGVFANIIIISRTVVKHHQVSRPNPERTRVNVQSANAI